MSVASKQEFRATLMAEVMHLADPSRPGVYRRYLEGFDDGRLTALRNDLRDDNSRERTNVRTYMNDSAKENSTSKGVMGDSSALGCKATDRAEDSFPPQILAVKKAPKKGAGDVEAQVKNLRGYKQIATEFKRAHPCCARCPGATTDIHHSRGRLGVLLTDTRFFVPVCRSCHDWIQLHPNAARTAGLLCQAGLWNVRGADE